MHFLEDERLDVADRGAAFAGVFPGSDVRKVRIIPLGFTLFRLKFLTEVTATGFVTVQRILAEKLGKFHKIRHAARPFQGLIELFLLAQDIIKVKIAGKAAVDGSWVAEYLKVKR